MTFISCILFWNKFLKSYPFIIFSVILFSFLKTRQETHRSRIQLLQGDAKSRKWDAKNYFLSSQLQNSIDWLNQNAFLTLTHYVALFIMLLLSIYTGNCIPQRKLRMKPEMNAFRVEGVVSKKPFFLRHCSHLRCVLYTEKLWHKWRSYV